MVSQAKQLANQLNASKSTGPRTDAGKQRSSQNRLTHGFYSARVVLPGEDAAEYAQLHAALVAEHRPQTATQQLCVDRIAACTWKLWRMERAQGRAYDAGGAALRGAAAYRVKELRWELEEHRRKGIIGIIRDEQVRAAEITDAERRAADADPAAVLCGSMADPHGAHDRYLRHEQRLVGMIHRTLAELRRLRRDREAVEALPEPELPSAPTDEPVEHDDAGDDVANERNEPTATRAAWSPSATTSPPDAPSRSTERESCGTNPPRSL